MGIGNITEGLRNSAKDKKGMLPKDISKLAKERKEICLSNECGTYIKFMGICDPLKGGCGCLISKKVYVVNEKCPKGYW